MHTPRRWQRQAAPLWDATPPPPRVKKYETLRVTSSTPLDLLIVNDRLEETWTHYVDSRTTFCSGPRSGCWLPHEGTGKPRYGAWLAVQTAKVNVTYLLRLTAVAVTTDDRLRQLAGQLRGMQLRVWRIHNYESAEMHCKLMVDAARIEPKLPSPDVRYCVERMIEADDRPKGANAGKWGSARAGFEASAAHHPQMKS
jgi:hypothetical protein